MAKPALGRGLGALINTRVAAPAPVEELGERIQNLALDQIIPSPLQPRKEFRSEHLQELVESIRERGVIQPLIVRKVGEKYELIAGERRWRASTELKLKEVPAIVREATDREVLELALIENLQREDLNPIEEAAAYERLHRDFEMTQEDISKRVGKSRASIANAMRLLDLEEEVQSWLKQGRLSVGHAKVLLSLKSPDEQKFLAEQIIRQGASVRLAEKLAAEHLARTGKSTTSRKSTGTPSAPELSPTLTRVQNLLTHRFATRVVLSHGEKRGTIQIEYYGSDDLNRLLDVLGVTGE
jgi:ParB family transcriptional regulator, chromosome partitioning protein